MAQIKLSRCTGLYESIWDAGMVCPVTSVPPEPWLRARRLWDSRAMNNIVTNWYWIGRTRARAALVIMSSLLLAGLATGCDEEGVDSEEEARAAYIGLDGAIAKSLTLGLLGFNEATSANIPEQMDVGDVSGTLLVNGQVDQGSSDNKGMRLRLDFTEYQDEIPEPDEELVVIYDTDPEAAFEELPYLEIRLRDIPDGTFEGVLTGEFFMGGELEGSVVLDLSFTGDIQDDGNGGVERVPGSVVVTGTADSEYGVYDVDVTL